MIFKQTQHRYGFHAKQNYHMSIYRRSIEKEQGNSYLKCRTQGEEEQNSIVLQIPNFSDQNEALDDQHNFYKGQRVGKHSN